MGVYDMSEKNKSREALPNEPIFVVLFSKKSLEDFVGKMTYYYGGKLLNALHAESFSITDKNPDVIRCVVQTAAHNDNENLLIISKELIPLWNSVFSHCKI